MEQSHFEQFNSVFYFQPQICWMFAKNFHNIHFGYLLSDFFTYVHFNYVIISFYVYWAWVANTLRWSVWISEWCKWRFRNDSMSSHHFFSRKFLCRMIRNLYEKSDKDKNKNRIHLEQKKSHHSFWANVITWFESKFVFIVSAAVTVDSENPLNTCRFIDRVFRTLYVYVLNTHRWS